MKNKPYPALLGGSYLFNEIKKRTPKFHETIPFINSADFLSLLQKNAFANSLNNNRSHFVFD
jgi:hypothetical protein